MDVTSLLIGIPGLVNDTLDLWERYIDYRQHQQSASVAANIQAAQKLRLAQWSRAVGVDDTNTSEGLDDRLKDPETNQIVKGILLNLRLIFEQHDEKIGSSAGAKSSASAPDKHRGHSKRHALKWAVSDKRSVEQQAEQIDGLLWSLERVMPADRNVADLSGSFLLAQNLLDELVKARAEHSYLDDKFIGAPSELKDFHEAVRTRASGTCDWILNHACYTEWKSTDGQPALLWISGPAGHGKSTLCSRILAELHEDLDAQVGFCMMEAQVAQGTSKFENILRVFLSQLMRQKAGVIRLVQERRRISTHLIATATDIWEVFGQVAAMLPRLIVAIDGFDEFPIAFNGRALFLEKLRSLLAVSSGKLLIVSRREADIETALNQYRPDFAVQECLLNSELLKEDLKVYATTIVNDRLAKHNETFRDEIASDLVEQCGSMFLWIKLQQDQFRSGRSKKELRKLVKETPKKLSDTYDGKIKQIRQKSDIEKHRAMAIIRWVLYAHDSLSVAQMAEILVISMTDISDEEDGEPLVQPDDLPEILDEEYIKDEIVALCASMLEVRQPEVPDEPGWLANYTIHVVHATCREPLLDLLRETTSPGLDTHSISIHANLAVDCIRYLREVYTHERAEDEYGALWIQKPFERYARWYWDWHIGRADELSLEIAQQMGAYLIENWQLYFPDALSESFDQFVKSIPWDCNNKETRPVHVSSALSLVSLSHLPNLLDALHILEDSSQVELSAEPAFAACLKWAFHSEKTTECLEKLLVLNPNLLSDQTCRDTMLALAVWADDIGVAKLILSKSPPKTTTPRKPCGHVMLPTVGSEIWNILLDNEALDPAYENCDGVTILHHAVGNDDLKILVRLADSGANLSVTNQYGSSILHTAALNAVSAPMVEWIIARGFDPDIRDTEFCSPLFYASQLDAVDLIPVLIKAGADVNATNNSECTPLYYALKPHLHTAAPLLDYGAVIDITNYQGATVVHWAAWDDNAESIKLLLSRGALVDATDANERTPLSWAAENDGPDAVKALLEAGADPFISSNSAEMPIHYAALHGQVEIARLLLEHMDDINVQGGGDFSPLGNAIYASKTNMVAFLLSRGADIHKAYSKEKGFTPFPLLYAVVVAQPDVVELLLKFCSPNIIEKNQRSALSEACSASKSEMLKLLLAHGVHDQALDHGMHAIHFACNGIGLYKGAFDCIMQLYDAGMDVHARTTTGWQIPQLPPDYFREALQFFFRIVENIRRALPASNLKEDLQTLPAAWQQFALDNLFAAAMLRHNVAWMHETVALGADVTALDCFGDTVMWNAYIFCHDQKTLETVRSFGLSLTDLGPPRYNKNASISDIHKEGSMTEAAYNFLIKILEEEGHDLNLSDPKLFEQLTEMRDVATKNFVHKRTMTEKEI